MKMVWPLTKLSNTVLPLEKTGTGKELIANAINFGSPRKNGPYIKVTYGAILQPLIDSELFAHEVRSTHNRPKSTRTASGKAAGHPIS